MSTTTSNSAGVGGTGGGGGAGTITVVGQLIDYGERPVPIETVMIGQKIAVTDSDGRFSLTEVSSPYTLRIVDMSGVSDFVGLTATTPTVQIFKEPLNPNQAFIDGTLGGTSIPLASNQRGRVQYSAALDASSDYLEGAATTFDIYPDFYSPTEQGHLRALTWVANASAAATSYLAYGSTEITLAPRAMFSPHMTLSPISSGSAHIQVSLSGSQSISKTRPAIVDNGGSLFLHATVPAGNPIDLITPVVPGGTLSVTVFADEGEPSSETVAFVQGQPFSGNISVTMPATTTLDSPPDSARVQIVGTTFSWTSPPGQLNAFFIGNYAAYTMADSIEIPDLADLGVHFDPGQVVNWSVIGFGSYDTIDSAAGSRPIYRDWQRVLNSLEPSAPTADGFISRPAGHSVTSQ